MWPKDATGYVEVLMPKYTDETIRWKAEIALKKLDHKSLVDAKVGQAIKLDNTEFEVFGIKPGKKNTVVVELRGPLNFVWGIPNVPRAKNWERVEEQLEQVAAQAIKKRGRKGNPLRDRELHEKFMDGQTRKELAEEYGISYATVCNIIKRERGLA